jgi:hypothetical protein
MKATVLWARRGGWTLFVTAWSDILLAEEAACFREDAEQRFLETHGKGGYWSFVTSEIRVPLPEEVVA